MSLGYGDASSWAAWAATHELPQEHIMVSGELEEAEQGWPPGMMDEECTRTLHDMGVRNTRSDQS